jgi:hypothetical protein
LLASYQLVHHNVIGKAKYLKRMILQINLIVFIASFAVIFPIIMGSITVKKSPEPSLIAVLAYCIIYLIMEIIGWYYALRGLQNHFLNNIIPYIDLIFIGIYFYQMFITVLNKRLVVLLTTVSLLSVLTSHLTGDNFNQIDSIANSISNICMIAVALLFFYQLLNNLNIQSLLRYHHFWIVAGILIYFSGIFFIHIFAEYITFNKDSSITIFWDIKDYLLLIFRIFLAIGLWFSTTHQQLSPSSK